MEMKLMKTVRVCLKFEIENALNIYMKTLINKWDVVSIIPKYLFREQQKHFVIHFIQHTGRQQRNIVGFNIQNIFHCKKI